jgi:nucleoside-diphosphate-sugar epimerase
MDRVLARKPLSTAEASEPPCTVCVTGAAGYVASNIVCRLLAAGHTVHATYRDKDDQKAISVLKALPEADRLKWFKADLLAEGSFDAALEGCK